MENPEDCQPGDDHDQGGVTPVDEHLVDGDLKEQRSDQAAQLDEQGGDQHLRQGLAVTQYRRQKPGKAKTADQPVDA
jgi:hypothetical protein